MQKRSRIEVKSLCVDENGAKIGPGASWLPKGGTMWPKLSGFGLDLAPFGLHFGTL